MSQNNADKTIRKTKRRGVDILKFVIQRVLNASCEVNNQIIGKIENGLCVFIGISNSDDEQIADKMIKKLLNMRIFADENDKTNLNLADVSGSLLLISQFTLYANCRKGNRPSFIEAGAPQLANNLYEYIISKCRESVEIVETGEFGAAMKIRLENNGPFTIVLNSDDLN